MEMSNLFPISMIRTRLFVQSRLLRKAKFVDMFSKLIAYKFALNFSCADVERFSSRESSVK